MYWPLLAAFTELSTERMFARIPASKIVDYLERYSLPDWWAPVIFQLDQNSQSDIEADNAK